VAILACVSARTAARISETGTRCGWF